MSKKTSNPKSREHSRVQYGICASRVGSTTTIIPTTPRIRLYILESRQKLELNVLQKNNEPKNLKSQNMTSQTVSCPYCIQQYDIIRRTGEPERERQPTDTTFIPVGVCVLEHPLVVLRQGRHVDHGSHVVEAVNPLLPFVALSPHVVHLKRRAVDAVLVHHNACSLFTTPRPHRAQTPAHTKPNV